MASSLSKTSLFNLPIIDYNDVRNRGHKQQMGIYKPKNSIYVSSIISNVGESQPNYEDNISDDLVLTYHGRGKDKDQTLDDYDNKALYLNYRDQVPVNVFAGGDNKYRDWGKWLIVDLGTEPGTDGFIKLVFKLEPHESNTSISSNGVGSNQTYRAAKKKLIQVERQVRYAPELRQLKKSYNYKCQVNSSHEVQGRTGSKMVVHHLYPVGEGGPLVTKNHGNEIVLCPNCHSLFDDGSIFIDWNDGQTLHHWNRSAEFEGKRITLNPDHILDRSLLEKAYILHWK